MLLMAPQVTGRKGGRKKAKWEGRRERERRGKRERKRGREEKRGGGRDSQHLGSNLWGLVWWIACLLTTLTFYSSPCGLLHSHRGSLAVWEPVRHDAAAALCIAAWKALPAEVPRLPLLPGLGAHAIPSQWDLSGTPYLKLPTVPHLPDISSSSSPIQFLRSPSPHLSKILYIFLFPDFLPLPL